MGSIEKMNRSIVVRKMIPLLILTGLVSSLPLVAGATDTFGVVNEFNIAIIMLNLLTLLASGAYILKGQDLAWGAIATVLWFITALAMLADNPGNWIAARVYGAFGMIFVVLTLVSVIRSLNPEDSYFDDWE